MSDVNWNVSSAEAPTANLFAADQNMNSGAGEHCEHSDDDQTRRSLENANDETYACHNLQFW
jgi:hypothetical protein